MTGLFLISSAFGAFVVMVLQNVQLQKTQEVTNPSVAFRQDEGGASDGDLRARKLIAVASDDNESPIARQMALELLAQIGTPLAVTGLLDNLLVEASVITPLHATARYPAATGLRQIGAKAYPQVWGRLERECSDDYLFLLALAVSRFESKTVTVGRLKERLAMDDATKEQKANLQRLLKLFETVDFDNPKNWKY